MWGIFEIFEIGKVVEITKDLQVTIKGEAGFRDAKDQRFLVFSGSKMAIIGRDAEVARLLLMNNPSPAGPDIVALPAGSVFKGDLKTLSGFTSVGGRTLNSLYNVMLYLLQRGVSKVF